MEKGVTTNDQGVGRGLKFLGCCLKRYGRATKYKLAKSLGREAKVILKELRHGCSARLRLARHGVARPARIDLPHDALGLGDSVLGDFRLPRGALSIFQC